jgi:hypothetical protein
MNLLSRKLPGPGLAPLCPLFALVFVESGFCQSDPIEFSWALIYVCSSYIKIKAEGLGMSGGPDVIWANFLHNPLITGTAAGQSKCG